MTIPESTSAIVARNERWDDVAATTEPYEAGWAREVIFFVRNLTEPKGDRGSVRAQISADGMLWVDEGTTFVMPQGCDGVAFCRLNHFGNWVRLVGSFDPGSSSQVLVTAHCKS